MTDLGVVVFELLDEEAMLPSRSHPGDAGLDLAALHGGFVPSGGTVLVGTGVSVDIPHGFVGLVCPRSGLAVRHDVTVLNAPGVVDSGYSGEVKVALVNHGRSPFSFGAGERIAQLVIQRVELPTPVVGRVGGGERGEAGFGSTGA